MNPANRTLKPPIYPDYERNHARVQATGGMFELVGGVTLHAMTDVGHDRDDEEEYHYHRRGQVHPRRPAAQFDERRDQKGRKRVKQRRSMRDVHIGVRQMVLRCGHLPVFPDAESERQQKDESGRQQGQPGVDAESHGPTLRRRPLQ